VPRQVIHIHPLLIIQQCQNGSKTTFAFQRLICSLSSS
jgi:hypothetical protein